ncbi:hypothetical protein ACSSNL_04410 [Thalassobius sp. S69A]|uniref:hypothetical protein n=1 Tax=unclassified Thalassovita TaxID=2619711 RepID=UPI003C7CC98D
MSIPKLYLTESEVARLLGRDIAWLRANGATLEAQYGFPKIDCATGRRHREAIEAWASDRNIRRRHLAAERLTENNQEKYHEL